MRKLSRLETEAATGLCRELGWRRRDCIHGVSITGDEDNSCPCPTCRAAIVALVDGAPSEDARNAIAATEQIKELAQMVYDRDETILALRAEHPATPSEDTRRLDWLEEASAKRGILLGWEDDGKVQRRLYEPAEYAGAPEEREELEGTWRVVTNTMTPDGTGLREAIDAARAATDQPEKT